MVESKKSPTKQIQGFMEQTMTASKFSSKGCFGLFLCSPLKKMETDENW